MSQTATNDDAETNGEAEVVDIRVPEGKQRVQIQGTYFLIDKPYGEGYQLKKNEAAAMNQLLAENVRNNYAGFIKAAKAKSGGWTDQQIEAAKAEQLNSFVSNIVLPDEIVAELQEQLDEYVSSYEFGLRTGRAGKTPFEREVETVARADLDQLLRERGHNPSKLFKNHREKYDALYNRLYESNKDDIERRANERLNSLKAAKAPAIDLDSLIGIDDDAGEEAEENSAA
jgi:hypothetical protein